MIQAGVEVGCACFTFKVQSTLKKNNNIACKHHSLHSIDEINYHCAAL